jgi:CRISPR-associated protein Csc1
MYLLRCKLTLHDTLFFATREMGPFFETERYIHNYALAYALFGDRLIRRPFFCDSYRPAYAEDLGYLNDVAVYITPAQPLTWDYVLVTWKIGQVNYYRKPERFGDTKRNYPANIGLAKEIAPESVFEFYVFTKDQLTLPRWIRLGKWMSKALIEIKEEQEIQARERNGPFVAICALNPLDIPQVMLNACDIVSMPPSSLITNAHLEGQYYELGGSGRGLPTDMRFTIPDSLLKETPAKRNRNK